MAGPTCSVLLREPLDSSQVAELREIVSAAGWADRQQVLLCSVEAVDEGPELYGSEEQDQIEAAFGWRPQSQIVCVSMIGIDAQYHRLLAQGALALAQRFAGVVDLGGTLSKVLDGVGQRAVVTYRVRDDHTAAYWVVDAPYLAAWIDHPWFRMAE